eukprot:3165408-Alexandrium_andersonii.AAC.1
MGWGPLQALKAKLGVQRRNLGDADFCRFRAREKDASPCGPAGGRSPFHMDFRPILNFSQ